MKKNLFLKIMGLALAAALTFTAFNGVNSFAAAAVTVPQISVSNEDTVAAWEATTAKKITLNGTTATVSGNGVSVKGGVVTITAAGTYVISGKLTNGQIVVSATTKDTVRLVLNGADITNLTGAAIYAKQCDKLITTLESGTKNSVTDGGAKFAYADTTAEEPNAAIFSKDDLSINGTGELTVNAGFNNGIGTKDDLVIANGTITVNAANDGIKGKDSVTILGGTLNIKAGNDGIQSSNSTDTDKGWTIIQGGTFNITSAHDGIQAETQLNISGGTFAVMSGGGAAKAQTVTNANTASDSFKGIKSGGDLTVSGGTFTLDTLDDGVHTGGNAVISGGTFTVSTGDDGIHADGDLTVKGGKITVTKSYEGLEGNNISISGGTISVTATDDGINAAGGADGSGMGGRGFGGGDRFAPGTTGAANHTITISGGTVTVYANSDVLDSNGSIGITGGTVCLFKMQGEGELLDADSTISITPALFGSSLATGTKFSITSAGKTLWSGSADKAVTSFALILPGLTNGASYTLQPVSGTTSVLTATTSVPRMNGGMGGGFGGQRPGGRP